MMDYQEAIEVFQDKNTCIGTTNCDDNAWKLLNPAINTAISAMQELQMYKDGKLCLIPESVYSKQCTELDAYKQLGTLEEVQEAMKKHEKERIRVCLSISGAREFNCGYCGCYVDEYDVYCKWCGQHLDWGEEI